MYFSIMFAIGVVTFLALSFALQLLRFFSKGYRASLVLGNITINDTDLLE